MRDEQTHRDLLNGALGDAFGCRVCHRTVVSMATRRERAYRTPSTCDPRADRSLNRRCEPWRGLPRESSLELRNARMLPWL
jgi:hypothetical protein